MGKHGKNKPGKKQGQANGSKLPPKPPNAKASTKPDGPANVNNLNDGDADQTLGADTNPSTVVSLTICSFCQYNLPGEWLVQCDDCDRQFHYDCVGYDATTPEKDPWSCPECVGNVLSSTALSRERSLTEQTRAAGGEPSTSYQARSLALRMEFANKLQQLRSSHHRSSDNPAPANRTNTENRTVSKKGTSGFNDNQTEASSRNKTESKELSSNQQIYVRTGTKDLSKSNSRSVSSEIHTVSSKIQSVRSKTQTLTPNGSSVSTKASSRASSHRRRAIELQKVQEEYELQKKIDDEKLALERKAIELKEAREKKLMEGKFRAMEDNVSIYSGSSINTKADTRRSTEVNVHTPVHSELVQSWIHEQREQNYQTETIGDVERDVVSNTLGINISVPVNARELESLNRQHRQQEIQKRTTKSQSETGLNRSDATFTIDRTTKRFLPLTSVTPAYHWNPINPTSGMYDGRMTTTQIMSGKISNNQQNKEPLHGISIGQPMNQFQAVSNSIISQQMQQSMPTSDVISKQYYDTGNSQNQQTNNNRISWDLNRQRPNQQSTHIDPMTNQKYTIRTGNESQSYNGHGINQNNNPTPYQSRRNNETQGPAVLTFNP